MEVIEAARQARGALRRTYWAHATFLADRSPFWMVTTSDGPTALGQSRKKINRITRIGKRGTIWGRRQYLSRSESQERSIFPTYRTGDPLPQTDAAITAAFRGVSA